METVINKIVMPGWIDKKPVFVRINYNTPEQKRMNTHIRPEGDSNELSITGVVNPKSNGNADRGGQCDNALLEIDTYNEKEGWTRENVVELYRIWNKYHLNHMNPGCPCTDHIDMTQKIPVYSYGYGNKHRIMEEHILSGRCVDYTEYLNIAKKMRRTDYYVCDNYLDSPEHNPEVLVLIEEGYLEVRAQVEQKAVGWVDYTKHPEGWLLRPCPVCGYKYGSEWTRRDIPTEVLQWLVDLPETQVRYAWKK